jgi:uncharacterized membrane protein YkvA (DUF1232 family)
LKFLDKAKARAKELKREITALYYACKNPELPVLPRIMILLTLGYALSPIDLIPDFIPVLGYLDDLIILPILITLSIKMIPGEIMRESRERAEKEPLRLKDNWLAGAIFILAWVFLLAVIVLSVTGLFRK